MKRIKAQLVVSPTPKAETAGQLLKEKYHFSPDADLLLVLGGDGFMLETLHAHHQEDVRFYGLNLGTVGFLLNPYSLESLDARLEQAEETQLRPLQVEGVSGKGSFKLSAFNDVSAIRTSSQSSHLKLEVNGKERIQRLIGDGVIVSTSAGSSAYNASAGGMVVPLGADILALTPICSSSHRSWRGALLDDDSEITITNLDPQKRPICVDADSERIEEVTKLTVKSSTRASRLLFDPGHQLEERILDLSFGKA